MTKHSTLNVITQGQGLLEITRQLESVVQQAKVGLGMCHLFVQHTSCSLLIQENADPSARRDLESWLNRLVPENDSLYTHIYEGSDDMPAHIKASLTATSLSIPIIDGRLALGTWQGVYLWEHRHSQHNRRIIAHIQE